MHCLDLAATACFNAILLSRNPFWTLHGLRWCRVVWQVDPDKAFAVQMAHEESVLNAPQAYMQCALLYTSSQGERRIR